MNPKKAALTSRQTVTNIVISIASLICGFLLNVFATEAVLIKYNNIIISFITVLVGITIFLILMDLVNQIKETQQKIDEDSDILDKVASLVTFIERKETVTVTPEGDGIFEDRHTVRYTAEDDTRIEQLHFPIIIDIPGLTDPPGSNVLVMAISVDGTQVPTDAYIPKEIRHPCRTYDGRPQTPQEYGIVKVPVSLSKQKRQSVIIIKIRYKSIFKEFASSDYVVVDIPYVTRNLSVRICAENSNCEVRAPAGADLIEATCEMMDLNDRFEAIRQSPKVSNGPKYIEWNTQDAKIGYRYIMRFRVIDLNTRGHA
jgi:hypothetical protein